jgi:uncharacterized protein
MITSFLQTISNFQYILVFALGYTVAQSAKFVINLRKNGFQLSDVFESGGMPSSHASVVFSFATLVCIRQGLYSPISALSLMIAMIVVYDATHVRYSSGQQGEKINQLGKELQGVKYQKLRVSHGHTLSQVIAGSVCGVVVGVLVAVLVK